ncbi:hypothetical protein [Modicisalibacter coralii]|uniref:hypothetical protein n=1 Tax=Modicisalibacter coralii TaxID=2304602 RepID=UPI00100B352A|nr:hypothetical protein [Halomonas coralii]
MRLLFSKPKYVIAAGVMTFALAILASGWANTYKRLQDQREVNANQREIIQGQIKSGQRKDDMNLVALNGALAAWRFQQGESGAYEAKWLDRVEKLNNARRYIGYLRGKLKGCTATTNMLGDEGWTGNADIKPEASE